MTTKITFGELPPEVQVAWDRDMCHEPWVDQEIEFYECLNSDPSRYVAWSPKYLYGCSQFAAYVVDDERWYRFKSDIAVSPFNTETPWRTRVITDP